MIADIRVLLAEQPFVPFTVRVADGREYPVPTPDHAHVHFENRRVSLWTDAGREITLPPLLISGLEKDITQAEPSV